MQLEQMMGYQPSQKQRTQERERTYTTVNLESMSASALYTGDMTIRPLGQNSALHIHEGTGGTAHIKTRDGQYHNLNSYDAAMTDFRLDKAGTPKIRKTTEGFK